MLKKILVLFFSLCGLFFSFAGDYYDEELLKAVRNNDYSDVKYYLSNFDVNVNYENSNGETPLMIACKNQNLPIIKLLFEEGKGVNFSFKNARGQTTLMIAVKYTNNIDIIRYLLENGSNANDSDNFGKTVLMYAAENGDIIIFNYLINEGKASFNAEAKLSKEGDALMFAVRNNMYPIVKILLDQSGINLDQTDIEGRTAFMIACEKENTNIVRLFFKKKGFYVTKEPNNGIPPLLWCIKQGLSETIIRYILQYGDDALSSKDDLKRDALWYAKNYGDDDIINLILEFKSKKQKY